MSLETTDNDNIGKEKYKDRLKNLNEHYDAHIDEILPDYFHRGDLVSASRFLGYADAMMATCATFLVLPIRHLKDMKPGQSLSDFLEEIRTEFVMFFLGFLIVCTIWESINIRSFVIKRFDDFLVLMGIVAMLVTTVLPFSLALQGHFPHEKVSTVMTCIALTVLEILEIFMFFYAFSSPRMLHVAMHEWSKKDRRFFRNVICLKSVGNVCIIVTGGLLSLVHYVAAWAVIAILILLPLIRKFVFMVRRRRYAPTAVEKCQFWYYYTRGNISKERVEVFSDAATAIIACILILDITVEEFPTAKKVKEHGLTYELEHMSHEFYTFIGVYIIVSLLWYVNHTILNLFHTVNVVVLYLQKVFLAFTALSPLGGNMMTKYATKKNDDAKVGIRYAVLFVFCASFCNLAMLCWAFYVGEKVLHKWANRSCLKENIRQHLYVILKTLNVPVWSLICILGTLGSAEAVEYVLIVCFTGSVVTFIMLKLIFLNHFGKDVSIPLQEKKEAFGKPYSTEDIEHVIAIAMNNHGEDDLNGEQSENTKC